ncbi:hypothetical protein EB001_25425, partial [bacterium]|nr:hypothetical protein [bacterium]
MILSNATDLRVPVLSAVVTGDSGYPDYVTEYQDIVVAKQSTAAIENSDSLVFYVYPTTTISRNISGSKQLVKYGTGRLVLSGAKTYTGNTTIDAGTLELQGTGLGSGTYNGTITNNGTLILSPTTSQTLAGNISGSGSIHTLNNLTLSGNNTFTGDLSCSVKYLGNPVQLDLTNSNAAGNGNIIITGYSDYTRSSLNFSGFAGIPLKNNIICKGPCSITSYGTEDSYLSGGLMFAQLGIGNSSPDITFSNAQTSGNFTILSPISSVAPQTTSIRFYGGTVNLNSSNIFVNSGVIYIRGVNT